MNISILGCGWLGLPLAKTLIKDGHNVHGSTTTKTKIQTLNEEGITPYLITLEPRLSCNNCEAFWQTELLILNIPPGRGRKNVVEYHTKQIRSIRERLENSTIKKIVFVSSTSVYPKLPGVVTEDDTIPGQAGRDSGNALLQAEKILRDSDSINTAVLRFGGLYGYDRHPAKYLAGRQNLDKGNAPVNLIHRDDCINIIREIIKKPFTKGIFNAVSDGHPPRKMYYTKAAKALGLELPTFKDDEQKDYKVVSNEKLKKGLGYVFKHPNPMDMKAINE
ncbi:MAG: SDR family oxidoreductase [Balneolaceae bacterium]|nr:SDR family oxidoreductase [Balneolaceae bacterium]